MVRDLQRQSSWPEARAALERAKGRLGDRGSAELRRLLDQGARDLELAARLDAIRLDRARSVAGSHAATLRRASTRRRFARPGSGRSTTTRRWSRPGSGRRTSGTPWWPPSTTGPPSPPTGTSPGLAAGGGARAAGPGPDGLARPRPRPGTSEGPGGPRRGDHGPPRSPTSPCRCSWHSTRRLDADSPERLPFLKRVQQAHPGDFWANLTLGRRAAAEKATRRGGPLLPGGGGHPAGGGPRLQQARRGAVRLPAGTEEAVEPVPAGRGPRPDGPVSSQYLARHRLSRSGRHDEAIEQLRAAIRDNPNEAGLHSVLGNALEVQGRYAEALAQLPTGRRARPERHGRPESGCGPSWCGWDGGTRRGSPGRRPSRPTRPSTTPGTGTPSSACSSARRTNTAAPGRPCSRGSARPPTRTSRRGPPGPVCSGPRRGTSCARPSPSPSGPRPSNRSKHLAAYPHFLFVRGLAEYRQGQLDRAIATMRGSAARVLGPAPRLVLAMALHRSGQVGGSPEDARGGRPGPRLAARIRCATRTAGSTTCSAARPRA